MNRKIDLTKENLERLLSIGTRWTKNGKDRVYINADKLGLKLEYYNTGSIKAAIWQGETISNHKGAELKFSKNFVDLNSGEIYSDSTHFDDEIIDLIISEVRK